MDTTQPPVPLTPSQFDWVCREIYRQCGIRLQDGKQSLVRNRLEKRLRELGLTSYDEYIDCLQRDRSGGEMDMFVDTLTTNKTSFFRESRHFDFLQGEVLPELARSQRVRLWSAACSTGAEAWSLAITLAEAWPDLLVRDVRILATDICRTVLSEARVACYDEDDVEGVPPPLLLRYFTKSNGKHRVSDKLRRLVTVARLNLIGDWPMRGPFDIIFCRNVMIYFDRPTQERLVQRLSSLMSPGGYLFVGHAESLSGLRHDLEQVSPAVYRA